MVTNTTNDIPDRRAVIAQPVEIDGQAKRVDIRAILRELVADRDRLQARVEELEQAWKGDAWLPVNRLFDKWGCSEIRVKRHDGRIKVDFYL